MKPRNHLRVLEGAGAPPNERPSIDAAKTDMAPKPEAPLIAQPFDYLSEGQKLVWAELYAEHGAKLGDNDRTLFAKLVVAEHLYREACRKVAEVGTLIKSPTNYPIQNPYLAVQNKQHALITRLSSELGLTPLSRARVKQTPTKKSRGANPFGELRTLD